MDTFQKRVTECIDVAVERYLNINLETRPQIWIKNGPVDVKLYVDEIFYFESSPTPHKLIVYLDNRRIEYIGKIKEVESMYEVFCRCHQSYVVNLMNVKEINKKERVITMANGAKCLVSTRHLKKVVNQFKKLTSC